MKSVLVYTLAALALVLLCWYIIPDQLNENDDPDGDRVPTLFEYHHGTDPNDPDSHPVFSNSSTGVTSPDPEVGQVHHFLVDWNLSAETTYQKQTIQAALDAASDFDLIEVLPGVYNENLTINNRVLLYGRDYARATILDGSGLSDSVIHMYSESVLDGFTIRSGSSSYGGGVYLSVNGEHDQPRIIGCLFIDNQARWQGGAMYLGSGELSLISCSLIDNQASEGAAIQNYNGKLHLFHTLLWNNANPAVEEIAGDTDEINYHKVLHRNASTGKVLIDGVDQATDDPGITAFHGIYSDSPAHHAGDSSLAHAPMDGDGEARTAGSIDIGIDEITDSDGDGLPESWTNHYGISDAGEDPDGDGLSSLEEYMNRADPTNPDTDGDLVLDGDEAFGDGTHGDLDGFITDPTNPDTDADGLPDGWEIAYGLNPSEIDSALDDPDGDGLTNQQEFASGSNPLSSDTDSDGMPDLYEHTYGLKLNADDSTGDPDNDGLSNLEEYAIGTHPDGFDTDLDLYPDGFEHKSDGFDPLVPHLGGTKSDLDGDGLTDFYEMMIGTNPSLMDTDGDGYSDKEEIDVGSFPTVPTDYPLHRKTTSNQGE